MNDDNRADRNKRPETTGVPEHRLLDRVADGVATLVSLLPGPLAGAVGSVLGGWSTRRKFERRQEVLASDRVTMSPSGAEDLRVRFTPFGRRLARSLETEGAV